MVHRIAAAQPGQCLGSCLTAPSPVSLVAATLLRGAAQEKNRLQAALLPHSALISCCGQDMSQPHTCAATTARVFNDGLSLFSLVPWWELPQLYTRLSDPRSC